MRLNHLLGIALLLGLHGMTLGDDAAKLNDSLAKWRKAKEECGGNYRYKVTFSSFSGFGSETEIVVRGNKVVKRSFREFGGPPAPGNSGENTPKWVEKGEEIGRNNTGAPAKTLDELYEEAASIVSLELEDFEKRTLRFSDDGLLLSCFTVDTRIADDAPIKGVSLGGLTLQKGGEDAAGKVYTSPSGKAYPAHWGAPPLIQTRDYRPLPVGYGHGSGTLVKWIQANLNKDALEKRE